MDVPFEVAEVVEAAQHVRACKGGGWPLPPCLLHEAAAPLGLALAV